MVSRAYPLGLIRQAALLLLALALLVSAGLGCRSVAAAPVSAAAAHGHCDKPGQQPGEAAPQAMACAVACAALPQSAPVAPGAAIAPRGKPDSVLLGLTAAPIRGPVPPPPRAA
ncbi:hypothetical protein [Sphingomonas sp.]|uniref:hypothetical protein n=1 Tax=Sphingomonas sp. TaxID=28214 RepID=UPI002B514AE4|nr:hypothetical protein [Sphingomonas sp.]HTG39538.1 hypothetical protein [Sphingomonas sp.]